MFYFVYHLKQESTGKVNIGISPCPEYDLALAMQDGQSTMHIISPPLRLPAAFRARNDAEICSGGALQAAFYSVKKSLAIYSGRERMPQNPILVKAGKGTDDNTVPEVAKQMAERLKGRMLRMDELESAFPSAGPSRIAMAAEYCKVHDELNILPGIMYKGYGGRVCARCGSTTGFQVSECPSCGASSCISCSECSTMGLVRECEPLYSITGESGHMPPVRAHEPILKYKLTPAQVRASEKVSQWYKEGNLEEALVWAVCGAGKTEVSFGAIAAALNSGARVLYAAPRRDVVAELGERIASAFPRASSSQYYSGSTGRSGHNTDITIATTHQAIRFYKCFDLTILDEVDAFPYQGSRVLVQAVRNARADGGKTLFMSATPSRDLMEASLEGRMLTATIPARHHGYPLPVPQVHCLGKASQAMLSGGAQVVPDELGKALMQSLESGNGHFVFVPRKSAAEIVCAKIAAYLGNQGHADARLGWAHSADPDREKKRRAFMEGSLDILVCTSIMERGVTVPGVDVSVLGADIDGVFDYRSLVQMAGRAGRQQARPTGNVSFFCESVNRDIKEAIGMIERMNEDAFEGGFLFNGAKNPA